MTGAIPADDFGRTKCLRLPGSPVHGSFFPAPDATPPMPAVVVIGGSGGREPWPLAAALARCGFSALSVAYFKAPGLGPDLRDIRLEYFDSAVQWLVEELSLSGRSVVLIGISRGSEAALLTAVHFHDFVCGVVACVPGNVALCSWPPGGPAWLLREEPLPYVERFGPDTEEPAALIPVERIYGPILFISAGRDEVWPSAAMSQAMSARLVARGHRFGHRIVDCEESDHSLGGLVRLDELQAGSGAVTIDAADAERAKAWSTVLGFLSELSIGTSKASV